MQHQEQPTTVAYGLLYERSGSLTPATDSAEARSSTPTLEPHVSLTAGKAAADTAGMADRCRQAMEASKRTRIRIGII